jgi:hypothetical protein
MFAIVFGTTSPALAGPDEDKSGASKPEKGHEHGDKGELEKGKHHDKEKPDNAAYDQGKNRPGHEHEMDHDGKHDDKLPPGLVGRSDERHKLLLERFEKRKNSADERRRAERERIRHRWGSALDKRAALEELGRHARIVARLERIKDIAESEEKPELAKRAAAALERENALHEKKMAAFASSGAAPSASGGAP